MTSAGRVLRDASRRVPDAEARLLLAHALGVPASKLLTLGDLDTDAVDGFEQLLTRREAGIPVQYLTGRAPFRHVDVAVGPGVFIPRPETEVMTGWALDRLAEVGESPLVVELCAGSGAISLAIADEYPSARQYAVELSEDAVGYAARNLAGTGVELIQTDMADALPELDGTVDLVIANPPYVPLEAYDGIPAEVREHEPTLALFSGQDGLDAMRVLAGVASRLLRPGGWVCAEHAEVQGVSAPQVFVDHRGFDQVRDHRDLTDRPRFVTARRVATVAGWPS
ncbi:peptide chain release factor N(5)-glutamine methyltransferase [Micropruina sp.]|uniref:peptide chain release factor N(5)-glutamine methyltransferase n=1 Tax=Micropruina sp. TaxID=2737536 RepID=UPI0026282766|nr:peptide chain release factor N(5)-glutamine methyltransferase [Micropruina sp.]